jgi:hypothetical protein
MRLLCDENVRGSIVRLLEQEGHDVERVQDVLDVGDPDSAVLEYATDTDRVVLTNDTDFLDSEGVGVLFLDTQMSDPRPVVTAIGRIERVTDGSVSNTVYHVPDGWV